MMIPISLIVDTLKAYCPEQRFSAGDVQFGRVSLFLEEGWRDDTLYVGLGSALRNTRGADSSGFVCIGEPPMTKGNVVVLPDSCDPHNVFNCLQNVFLKFSEYELEVMKAAIVGSYHDLIDVCYRFTSNPVLLYDSGYRVLALTPDAEIPGDPEWEYIRTKGTASLEMMKILREEGAVSLEPKGLPRIFFPTHFHHASIPCDFYLSSRYGGRVVAIDAFKPFSPADELAVRILTEAIELKMSRDEAFQDIRGEGPVYTMLHYLVTGVRLERSMIADRLQYIPSWTKGFFRVLFVPLGSVNKQSFDYYARAMERKVDSRSVLIESALVAIMHYRKSEDFRTVRDVTDAFLSDNDLKGGLSNELENLADLHDSYMQAVAALELAEGDRPLHLYTDYALKHILSFCSPEYIRLLAHPSLLRLKDLDEKNNTQLSETMQAFLENERSLVRTARVLHIHRNTLLYRINKIVAILDVDLENPNTRLHFLLSERLLKMRR